MFEVALVAVFVVNGINDKIEHDSSALTTTLVVETKSTNRNSCSRNSRGNDRDVVVLIDEDGGSILRNVGILLLALRLVVDLDAIDAVDAAVMSIILMS